MTSTSTSTAPHAGSAAPATKTFRDLGVDSAIAGALDDAGITNPFPIQELTLPLALSGADLIGQARTGTGKTLAFGIPMLQRAEPGSAGVQVLVIVPTRELCLQVADDLARAGVNTDLSVVACYGGKAIDVQIKALRDGADIVVGTPGRLLDLRNRGELDLSTVTGLVLDEADEMLDLGFLPDVEQLITSTADRRQTLLFSATMPSAVVSLARRYMNKPTFLRADVEEVHIAPKTEQHFFSCHRMDKPAVLARILQTPNRGLCVVFSRTKRMADILAEELRERGIDAAPIHSDLRQDARERALQRFRDGRTTVLVATEVAARGLDIDDVTHVVNYDCPDDEKMYLHRIGRTGRAGAAGVAITLALWNELARVEMIKRQLGIDVPTHEVFSTSPILDELFDLPARGAKAPRVTAHGERRDEAEPAAEKPGRRSGKGRGRGRSQAEKGRAEEPRGDKGRAEEPRADKGRAEKPTAEKGRAEKGRAEGTAAAEAPAAKARAADTEDQAGTTRGEAAGGTRTRRRVRRRGDAGAATGRQPEPEARTTEAEPEARTTEAEPEARTTEAEPEARTRGAEAEAGTKAGRVRRRVRQDRRGESTARQAEPEPAGEQARAEPARDEAQAAEGPDEEVRTRTRRTARGGGARTTTGARSSAVAEGGEETGGTRPARAGRGTRDTGGERPRTPRRDAQERAESTRTTEEFAASDADEPTRGESRGGRRRGGRGAGDKPSSRGGAHGRGKGRGGPDRGGRTGGARHDSRDDADRSRIPQPAVVEGGSDEARGGGRPRLDRPMVVRHLP